MRLAGILSLLALGAATLQAAPNLLQNADFEGEFTVATGLAAGWQDNSRSVDEGPEPIDVSLARLRETMLAAGRELPIINSEGGYSNPGTCLASRPCPADTIPPDRMARWLVRQYVAQLACGVRQFFFYNFFINGLAVTNAWEGFVEGDGQPRPNVPAYAAMTWLLDGAEFERTERPEPNVWVHHFRTLRGPLLVAWTQSGTTATLTFPAAVAGWDLMGAPLALPESRQFALSDAPVYLLQEDRHR